MPNWHGVELRHLNALQAVAAERSFSAAAVRLGYTQPAVSGQVLALERLIGARLFVRTRGSRPLQLTDEGEILLRHATAITARLDAAQADVAAVRSVGSAALHVGTLATVPPSLVAAILRLLPGRSSRVVLQEGTDSTALLELVERGKLELAFATLPLPEGPFVATPIYREPYVLLVRPTDPLAGLSAVTLDELTATPVLTLEASRAQDALEAAISAGGGRPLEVARRFESASSIPAFVEAGLGPALVPAFVAESAPDLVTIELESYVPPRVVALARHRDRAPTALAEAFVAAAAEAARLPQGARRPLRAAS
ncbi:MAG TPA: LysR family transcriptional regulator [Gaiellaceae bacterium]|nr:LysR family transcriptional regulator [Gaiellaceae bacterium]